MSENRYLKWLVSETSTTWWHDSANLDELELGIANGATGVTTNPVLIAQSLYSRPEIWAPAMADIPANLKETEKAEIILERITKKITPKLQPIFENTKGEKGYVCAQVNPACPGDSKTMISMALRLSKWAPNVAVKLPVTAAGLDALEECAAQGITITATASFTVPQVVAVAERYRKGLKRAKEAGIIPGKCYAVIMVGRIDDYLMDVVMDRKANVAESDIKQAGIAIAKHAYSLFSERGYEAVIMPAGMRGAYHATELAGAGMVFSIHPKIQAMIKEVNSPWKERMGISVDDAVIKRLKTVSEFSRAYEPEGMQPEEFITFGVVQKTLSQFVETGWKPLETYKL